MRWGSSFAIPYIYMYVEERVRLAIPIWPALVEVYDDAANGRYQSQVQ